MVEEKKTRNEPDLKTVFFLIIFIITGIVGSAITYGLVPKKRHGGLGALQPETDVEVEQAFFVEMLLTMLLVFTVFSSTSNDNGRKDFGFTNAFAIGLSVTVAHLVGVSLLCYYFIKSSQPDAGR